MGEALTPEVVRELIRAHARERHGAVMPPDALPGAVERVNPACGDRIALVVELDDAGDQGDVGDADLARGTAAGARPVGTDDAAGSGGDAAGSGGAAARAERRIRAVTWQGRGCEVSQASASMLSDALVGATVESATHRIRAFIAFVREQHAAELAPEGIGDAIALAGVGRFPLRGTCATLAWAAALDALC